MKSKHVIATVAATLGLIGTVVAQPLGGGPDMMGGGAYGMGSGMTRGYGGSYGMGPGMMWGDGNQSYAGLQLSAEQRKKIAAIQQDTSKAMWQLMGTMHEQGYHMQGMFGPGAFDETAARKAFETMQQTQKAMFEMRLEAHRRIDAVLTQEQREQLNR